MYSKFYIRMTWLIVFCFAILQAFSPLMHSHIEADSPNQGEGFHIHLQELVKNTPTFEDVNHSLHTVLVEQGLFEQHDILPPIVLAVLFMLFFMRIVQLPIKPTLLAIHAIPFYLRPRSRPRAPPAP